MFSMDNTKIKNYRIKIMIASGLISGLLLASFITFSTDSHSLPNPDPDPLFAFDDNEIEINDAEYVEADGVRTEKTELEKLIGELVPKSYSLKKRENMWVLLKRAGFSHQEIHKITKSFSTEFDTNRLMPKHKFDIYRDTNNNFVAIVFPQDKLTNIVVTPNTDKTDFETTVALIKTTKKKREVTAIVDDNFLTVAKNNNIPNSIAYQFLSAFDGGVNFKRDLRKGDKFKIIFEEEIMPDKTPTGEGQILAAELSLSKKTYYRYFYIDKKGFGDFYDENGNSSKRFLSVYPIGNARVTSAFGMRFHPILKRNITHRAIDFRAKIGTPVKAAGDGVITHIGTKGAYGKYLRISHNGTYSTAYAHLNGFNNKLRIGSRVKKGQIVAYTGNTGRSTGPHLHFELIKGRTKVNPFKENAVIEKFLSKEETIEFKKLVASFQDATTSTVETAMSAPKTDKAKVTN